MGWFGGGVVGVTEVAPFDRTHMSSYRPTQVDNAVISSYLPMPAVLAAVM